MSPALEPIYVALDLETTGLNTATDSIVEVGAVRFDRERVLDRFHTLVNPRRSLPRAVKALTGITDEELAAAPPLEVVSADVEKFLKGAEVVGHSIIKFDLPVLANSGIAYDGPVHDTNELANLVLPGQGEYSLAALCRDLEITNESPHRALSDAEASMGLFLHLQERAMRLPAEVLDQVSDWLTDTTWPGRDFFRQAAQAAIATGIIRPARLTIDAQEAPEPLKATQSQTAIAPEEAVAVLRSARDLPAAIPNFEERAEQDEMTSVVAAAFGDDTPLIVEAGTGTGKSLAYLIPAALHALNNGDRVVVSTATINLQDQLLRKDLPTVETLVGAPDAQLKTCQLKGRRNYLCLSRFQALRAVGPQSDAEALIASRILIWLATTETGDRSDLRLTPPEEAIWGRLSAEGADCTASTSPFVVDGTCFLQRARKEAEASHIVVVNHALLLANVAAGGQAIPPYQRLIIDEAHHIEEEATRRFGFTSGEREMKEILDRCEALAPQVQAGLKTLTLALGPQAELTTATRDVREAVAAVRARLEEFSEQLIAFLSDHSGGGRDEPRMLITRGARAQPDWSDIEIGWENLNLTLRRLTFTLEQQQTGLTAEGAAEMMNIEILRTEVDLLLQEVQGRANGLALAIEQDDPDRIVWLERARNDGTPVVSWVPLAVDETLQDSLYADLQTLVLTGATLANGEDFSYLQQRLGLMDARTQALGSPFQYDRAALVLLPSNIPEPSEPAYVQHLATAITEMVTASKGRALILFTSHASLRTVHDMAVEPLRQEGIVALAQGVDGSPRQLVRALRSTPDCAVFGTSSFWEGVDIPGEALSLLVITRLPFAVPTEPIFAARSATYEDPFREYALPQSVLRFKQGFGRLIRTRTDRGVMAVLDRRITSREYGRAYMDALPECASKIVPLRSMPGEVRQWLQAGATAPAQA
jgi:DNA polymerase-3 subunit epsilon/ATP-dependent DNA helicase DinG